MSDATKSIDACAAYYGADAEEMKAYLLDGEQRALALPNRGPLVFDHNGDLDLAIREAYSRYGFYIFEGVIDAAELQDIRADLDAMRARFPTGPESRVDAQGEPGLGVDHSALTLVWSKPLGDPLGGTELANGRHEIKMFEPGHQVEGARGRRAAPVEVWTAGGRAAIQGERVPRRETS